MPNCLRVILCLGKRVGMLRTCMTMTMNKNPEVMYCRPLLIKFMYFSYAVHFNPFTWSPLATPSSETDLADWLKTL
jgi:hypothetical protein